MLCKQKMSTLKGNDNPGKKHFYASPDYLVKISAWNKTWKKYIKLYLIEILTKQRLMIKGEFLKRPSS